MLKTDLITEQLFSFHLELFSSALRKKCDNDEKLSNEANDMQPRLKYGRKKLCIIQSFITLVSKANANVTSQPIRLIHRSIFQIDRPNVESNRKNL